MRTIVRRTAASLVLGLALFPGLVGGGVAVGEERSAEEVGGANGVDQADFQMPFPCGEVWGASTYGDHPAVDWNGVGPAAGPADFGLPVIASLGGTVLAAGDQSGYGARVTVDHGDGWATLYAHLSAIWVAPGQRVAMGTLLGSIGNTGTSGGPHLHWEQRYVGRTVPVLWADGTPISTAYGSPGPTHVSANCTERSYGVSLVPRPDGVTRPASAEVPAKRALECTAAGRCRAG